MTIYKWNTSNASHGVIAQEIESVIPNATINVLDASAPSNIVFFDTKDNTELLRITADGVTANPNVPVDETAQKVLVALNNGIRQMVQKKWKPLTPEELRQCYSHALEYDKDLADVIHQALVDKHHWED
jgi:hypothetical protein